MMKLVLLLSLVCGAVAKGGPKVELLDANVEKVYQALVVGGYELSLGDVKKQMKDTVKQALLLAEQVNQEVQLAKLLQKSMKALDGVSVERPLGDAYDDFLKNMNIARLLLNGVNGSQLINIDEKLFLINSVKLSHAQSDLYKMFAALATKSGHPCSLAQAVKRQRGVVLNNFKTGKKVGLNPAPYIAKMDKLFLLGDLAGAQKQVALLNYALSRAGSESAYLKLEMQKLDRLVHSL